ncbi:MAG TPA: hypothetical protein VFY29_06685 [Terriglobia bacterium]|nr:hypothetical protein [Terriglobia bacterium]
MREMLGSAPRWIVFGILMASCPFARSQDVSELKSSPDLQAFVNVGGYVLGETALQREEKLVVMLLAGWSETLSSDIASGSEPTVNLESGIVETLVAPVSQAQQRRGVAGSFRFREIPPGDYQPVVLRIRDGAISGVAIGDGARTTVGADNIADLELTLKSSPAAVAGTRHGGAVEREASVLEPPRPPAPRFPGGIGRTVPQPAGNGKKDLLGHIIVGLGIAASVFVFMKMGR